GSIGFWQNSDGQNLITGANGGWYSHNLANWLATQFPYLYGSRSSNDLTNKTNQDVANLYMSFFGESSKTDAQIMSAALSCYFTSSQLGGNSGGQWGFNSSSNGTGSKYYNVSSYGSAIGLSNNQSYTVMQLLQQCNTSKQNGTYNGTVCGSIFSGINQSGKIY
ncbi:MAG TPA: hypothetical protein VMA31_09870, partial [Bryobacteraceae bacterium]|nr:hypothetical protein [Bryobacteraceae bacterium]